MIAEGLVVLAFLAGEEAPPAPKRHPGPWEQVLVAAREAGRPVLLDFHSDRSPACAAMDRAVFSDGGVAAFADGALVVHRVVAGRGEAPDLAKKYGVSVYPTLLFADASGAELDRQPGALTREAFLSLARDVVAGDHVRGLRERVEKDPEDAVLRGRLGRRLALRDDPEAKTHLEKAVALDPGNAKETTVTARFHLAVLRSKAEQSPGAVAAFAREHPGSPAAVDAHRILLDVARQKGDEEAQAASLEVLAKRAPDAEVRNELAWYLATRGKELERALGLVEGALRDEPRNAAYLDTRAECLSRLGRHEEAVAEQRKAIECLDPRIPLQTKEEFRRRLAGFLEKLEKSKAPK
jgi:tetratricopeptide (TPR) repeat protein